VSNEWISILAVFTLWGIQHSSKGTLLDLALVDIEARHDELLAVNIRASGSPT
jgi:hypothetical protein